MQRFFNGEACVRVGMINLHDFLQLCEELGLQWVGGIAPLDYKQWIRFNGTHVSIGRSADNGDLLYSASGLCHRGMTMIDYSELNVQKHDPVPLNLSFLTE